MSHSGTPYQQQQQKHPFWYHSSWSSTRFLSKLDLSSVKAWVTMAMIERRRSGVFARARAQSCMNSEQASGPGLSVKFSVALRPQRP